MATQILSVQSSSLDNKVNTDSIENTITLAFSEKHKSSGYAFFGDDQMYIMLNSSCISSGYSQEEIARRNHINSSEPLKTGDFIFVDGELYQAKILGQYSDCGRLTKVENGPTVNDYKKAVLKITNPNNTEEKIESLLHKNIDIFNLALFLRDMTVEDVLETLDVNVK